MAQKPPPGPQPLTKGPKKAVPCPWCLRPNDMIDIEELQVLEVGTECVCDHCQRLFKVARLEPITIVFVKPITPAQARGLRR